MIAKIFIAIVLIGWVMLCFFKYQKWHVRKKKCTRLVHAHVTEVLEKKPMRGSGMLYKPIFLIEENGRPIRIESAYYSNLLCLSAGSYIDILVDPDDYSRFLYADDSLNRGLFADIICCCLPIIFLIGVLLIAKKK